MGKQKFTKQQGYVGAPNLGNSFSAPATHDSEVSVVFTSRNTVIHGWNGSTWASIYTWNGSDLQFTFQNTYQNYYIESMTGQQEEYGVSFFSTESYQGSSFRNASENSALHDLDEVPVYNAGDEGKMLTVMSDGSLEWLAADETTVVEQISVNGGARVIDGIIKSGFGYMTGKWSDHITFNGNTPAQSEFNISFWWKRNETPTAGLLPDFGLFGTTGGYQWRISDHPTSGIKTMTHLGPVYFAGGDAQVSKDPNVDHPWVHYAITRTSTSTKFYVDGVEKYDHGAATAFLPQDASAEFALGATDSTGAYSGYDTSFEGLEISEGSALDGAGVYALFNAGRPSQGGSTPPNMAGLEEHANITLHGNAQLVNGVLSLDGTSGTYASLPHSTDYDRESGDLTIHMWMKANTLPSNWNAALVSKMGAGWSGYIAAISTMAADAGGNMTTGGLQTTLFGGGNSNNRAAPSGGIALNTWHHVAFVMPAVGDYKMYFNGQEVHSYAPTNRITGTSGDLKIGGWQNGAYSGYLDGDIDGLFFQKSALTASEISDLHSAGHGE